MIFKSLYSSTLQAPLSWPDEVCGSSWETKALQLAVQDLGISCEVEEGGAGGREDHFFWFLGDEKHPLRDPPGGKPPSLVNARENCLKQPLLWLASCLLTVALNPLFKDALSPLPASWIVSMFVQ